MNSTLRIAAALAVILISTAGAEARRYYNNGYQGQLVQKMHRFDSTGWIDVAAQPAYPTTQSNRSHRAASRAHGHKAATYRTRRQAADARKTHQRPSQQETSLQVEKPQEYVKPDSPSEKLVTREAHEAARCRHNRGSTSLTRVVEPLRSKAAEIVRECGAVIVSTDCRGGATPNHRQGRAVDIAMRGRASPACIYAHLKNWPGGVSLDYWSAPGTKHVHFSYNRRHEWGLRFSHSRTLYGAVSKFKAKRQRVARLR